MGEELASNEGQMSVTSQDGLIMIGADDRSDCIC